VIENSLPGKGNAQADAICLAGGCERLEQPIPNFGSDARPDIANLDQYPAAAGNCRSVDASPIGHGLQCIHEQIH